MTAIGPTAAPLTIRLFGPFEVCVGEAPLPRLRIRRGQWLLALLVLRREREVQRSWLAGTLWPDSSESDALRSLRQTLVEVRRALGSEAGRLDSPAARTLRLDLAGTAADVVDFDAAVARGDAVSLAEAVALYRGPLLEGWTAEWVFQERQARELAYLGALERLAEQALAAGDAAGAARALRRATAADPLRENAHRGLMKALAAGGEYAAATQVYRELRLVLHREMNASPAPESTALYEAIRDEARRKADVKREDVKPEVAIERGEAPSSPVPSPAPQVVSSRWTLHHAATLPQPLTPLLGREREVTEIQSWLATTRLVTLTGAGGVGKTRLAIQVARELAGNTLEAGPAFACAAFADLAPVTDPGMVPHAVAAALGVAEQPGRPLIHTLLSALGARQLLLVLDNCEHLVEACATLAGTLLAGAPDLRILATGRQALGLTGEVAWRVPSLSLPDTLATHSPETLAQYAAVRLFVERARAVQPGFTLTPQNAPAVLQVCHRLDGIPLAIELAAAWARALSVQQLAARLVDDFRLLAGDSQAGTTAFATLPRQRTLRAAIQWSFDLLTGEEKALLGRLSVFVGGWTLEAAEAVCGDCGLRVGDCGLGNSVPSIRNPQSAIRNQDVLDLLARLIDRSLVQVEEGEGGAVRYRMLETVGQFARERLAEAGEAAALQDRHCDFFLSLAERSEAESAGPNRREWLDRLEADHDNLRAALAWSFSKAEVRRRKEEGTTPNAERRTPNLAGEWGGGSGERPEPPLPNAEGPTPNAQRPTPNADLDPSEAALRIAAALGSFWSVRGYWSEGRSWLEGALASGLAAPATRRAPALLWAGTLAFRLADYPAAQRLSTASLLAYRVSGDRAGIAAALCRLGLLAEARGEYDEARASLEESLANARALGDRQAIADALAGLGTVADMQGDYAAARPLYEASLGLMRALGARAVNIGLLIRTGNLLLMIGDSAAARPLQEEALAISREQGDRGGVAFSLNCLGMAQLAEQEEEAEALFAEALAIGRDLGDERSVAWSLHNRGLAAHARGDLDQAGVLLREALSKRWVVEDRRGAADSLRALGRLAHAVGDERRAVRLWAAGSALPDLLGTPRSPSEQADLSRSAAEARQRLGEESYAREWEAGRGLGWEEAVTFALLAARISAG